MPSGADASSASTEAVTPKARHTASTTSRVVVSSSEMPTWSAST